MLLAIGPHDDDLELFAAFSMMNYDGPVQPLICFDGFVQGDRGLSVGWGERATESRDALMKVLALQHPWRLHIPDNLGLLDAKAALFESLPREIAKAGAVLAPAFEIGGHPQHNVVAEVVKECGKPTTYYLTYANGKKSTHGKLVMPARGEMIARKLRALSCHESQMNLDPRMGCWPHFLRGLEEYIL